MTLNITLCYLTPFIMEFLITKHSFIKFIESTKNVYNKNIHLHYLFENVCVLVIDIMFPSFKWSEKPTSLNRAYFLNEYSNKHLTVQY